LKLLQHLLLLFALALHGHEEQKVEYREDENDRQEAQQRVGRRRTLKKKKGQNHGENQSGLLDIVRCRSDSSQIFRKFTRYYSVANLTHDVKVSPDVVARCEGCVQDFSGQKQVP